MTPAEHEVKRIAAKLRGAGADMLPLNRLHVMRQLLIQAETAERYAGAPDVHALYRLAAHCVVWAEEQDREPAK